MRMVHLALGRGGYAVEQLDDEDDPYVTSLRERYLFARRVIGAGTLISCGSPSFAAIGCVNIGVSLPSGLTMPMPVTTTRFLVISLLTTSFPFGNICKDNQPQKDYCITKVTRDSPGFCKFCAFLWLISGVAIANECQ